MIRPILPKKLLYVTDFLYICKNPYLLLRDTDFQSFVKALKDDSSSFRLPSWPTTLHYIFDLLCPTLYTLIYPKIPPLDSSDIEKRDNLKK